MRRLKSLEQIMKEGVTVTVVRPGEQSLKIVVREVQCPNCGADETHPHDADKGIMEKRLLIRGFKVCDEKGHWWSQCLVCSGYYDSELRETRESHDPKKGWF